jgi:hypothetical protein
MSETFQFLLESGGGVATVLLALSGTLFILYLVTILALVGWQKVRGR